ncbi:uncharacterized protein LOC119401657 [Rhipicephalus sanguineus]|uniref:uncharacterized protein LOC119401657 n=1 Tax=Rhipicephalus sanguineus TaxID=34632 RepID=UPI0020C27629|nr:uncharacterized protein LOC119401657 [Rhipicephalus sanguineus]
MDRVTPTVDDWPLWPKPEGHYCRFFNRISQCADCGSEGCSDLEELVVGQPKKDRFCRPHYAPSWERDKLRKCVCKRGFVRNSWGECISNKNCWRCKLRRYKDWHSCASACPATCGKPVRTDCPKKCSPGCECIPGSVVHPRHHHRCVKADSCSPKCPLHSKFKPCVSNCEPKCSEQHPQKCFNRCDTGGCVCDQGYAYFFKNHEKICVRESECSLFAPPPLHFTSKEIEHFNRGEDVITRPGGMGRNREGTPSRGGSRGPNENLLLGVPRPGAAGVGGNIEGAHPRGMPGGSGLHEGEQPGPSPFNGGLAGEALNFLRERMRPSGTEGGIRSGTGPSTGLASAPSLSVLDHNARMRLSEGGFLARGSETSGEDIGGLQPLVPPLQNRPIRGGTSSSDNAGNKPLHVSSLPGRLGVDNERETLLPTLSDNHLPGELGMRPGANIAASTSQRGPTGEGANSHPEMGQPHGTSEHPITGYDESEEITRPLPVGSPGGVLPGDLSVQPRPPASEGQFPGRSDENPFRTRQFGGVETRGMDVGASMLAPSRPSDSGNEEIHSERLEGMPSPISRRPGEPGFRTQPSSATTRAFERPSESNNNESVRSTKPPAATESGERDVSDRGSGASSHATAGNRSGEAEFQPLGPVTSSETASVRPGIAGPESGVSEVPEVPNDGETEEITSGPSNVRPGESVVGTGIGRTGERVSGRHFPLGASTEPVGRPSFGVEEYRNDGFGRRSFSAISHGMEGYGGAGVEIPRQRISFDVTPAYGRPHFAFYPPRATTRGAAEIGESGFDETTGFINPPVGTGAHGSNMFMDSRNGGPLPAGAENRFPGGMGLSLANRQPFFRIPYRRHGAGVHADFALRVHGVPGYGGGSARIYADDISRSRMASHEDAGLRFLPRVPPIPGRREHGGEEFPMNRGATNLGALTEYERARLRSFLVPPRVRALVRHIIARPEFLPGGTPINANAGHNSANVNAVVRDALLRANTAGRGADASGLYDERVSSGHVSLHNRNWLHLRPEGYHGTRSVEYELARLSENLEDVCSERETRVQKEQPEPEFCKPNLVHPSKVHKKRTCICADGYVRNAWDRCILENECKVCKNEPTKDYNNFCVCAYKCGQPAATKCGQDCKPGCDCPPGYSRIANGDCVSINDCPPICPGNSTFNLCFSGCEPLCRLGPRKKDCVPSCNVGNCICIQGYAMESGICYPWEQCPKN